MDQARLKQVIGGAMEEIHLLRRRNEILEAKQEMVDLFATVLNTRPASPSRPFAADVAWQLQGLVDDLEKEEPDMDITEIDVVSFAARVAHVAASELYSLLDDDLAFEPQNRWYVGARPIKADLSIADEIAAMAGYVAAKQCAGETLYLRNVADGVAKALEPGPFASQPLALRQAYDLFARSCGTVSAALLTAQQEREAEIERLTRPAPVPLALEDSIFRPVKSLGEMRPEAVAAQALGAERDKLLQAEADAERMQAQNPPRSASSGDVVPGGAGAQKPAPLSIGDTPPAPPVNRGGRGRRKKAG